MVSKYHACRPADCEIYIKSGKNLERKCWLLFSPDVHSGCAWLSITLYRRK